MDSCYDPNDPGVSPRQFASKEEALAWAQKLMDAEQCADNLRLAFADSPEQVEQYNWQEDRGCCGSFAESILVDNRLAFIGFNYGH